MKFCMAALCMTLGVMACMGSPGGEQLATDEHEAIGVCGANADPVTGVMCRYRYDSPAPATVTFTSYELYEQGGLDYIRCTWGLSCPTYVTPESDSGARCVSTIGTGCSSQTITGPLVQSYLLPPGTTAEQAATYCQNQRYPSSTAIYNGCRALEYTVEQYEDRCCVARPTPTPVPGGG